MDIPVNAKIAVALLTLSSFAGALRGQVLSVNKYACSANSYTTTLPPASPLTPGGPSVSSQCSSVQTAVLNDLVVYFVTIVNNTNPPTPPTSGPFTLTDNLPKFFQVAKVLCAAFGGASTGFGAGTADCSGSYSGGPTLTLPGLTIPSTGGSSVVIEVEGYFTANGADTTDFNNCATGTPSPGPTNMACKLVTVPGMPAQWDLAVSKTFTQDVITPGTFHTTLTLKNDSPNNQLIYLTNFLRLIDRLNIDNSTTVIPAIQYTLSNFACNTPASSTCPTNLPSTSATGVLDTSFNKTTIFQFLWQQAYPAQGYIASGDTITIKFDITFAPICAGGSLKFNNEAFLALFRTDNGLVVTDNISNNNDVFVPPSGFFTYNYPAGPACPSVGKTAAPNSLVPWSTGVVTYTITVTNPTSSTATINVVDSIAKATITPPFTLAVTSGPTCTPTAGSSCGAVSPAAIPALNITDSVFHQIFTLPVTLVGGGSATVTFNATFTNLDTCEVANGNLVITNAAQMTATFANGGTVGNPAVFAPITMAKLPDCTLKVTKSTTSTGVTFGTPITYTVSYTNSGNQPAKISTLTDMLSEGPNQPYGPFSATVNSITCNGITPTNNKLNIFGGTLNTATSVTATFTSQGWTGNPILILAPGSQMTFPPGTLTCTIVITPQKPPPAGSCNGDQDMINAAFFDQGVVPLFGPQPLVYAPISLPLPTCRQIGIQKTTTEPSPGPGGPLTFKIIVANNGGSAVSGITLKDPMPPGFTINTVSYPFCTSPPVPPTPPSSSVLLTLALPTLQPNNVFTVCINASAPAVGGSYQNIATIDFGPQTNVYNSGDGNTFNVANVKVQTPTLGKAFSPSMVMSGGQSSLIFTIMNPYAAASGLKFTDNLPAGLVALTSPAPVTTCGGSVQIAPDGSSITFSNGSIAGSTGSTAPPPSCTITVAVQATPCGAIVNQWSSTAANSNITNINNLDPTGASATLTVSGNCPSAGPTPIIEICKMSSTANPVPASGIYNFTVTGSAFSSPQNPLMVPVGECSGPIPVTGPTTATITELPTPGVGVSAITATGYSPPPLSAQGNLLESYSLQNRTATVMLRTPAAAGDLSLQTLVIYNNYMAPAAQLKVCKIAGANVAVGTPFAFTLTPSTGTSPGSAPIAVMVKAGPLAQGGFCTLIDGTFQVGTSVTVAETLPSGYASPPVITVNGTSTPSAGCTPSVGGASLCSVVAAIGPGINEVSFTNSTKGTSEPDGMSFALRRLVEPFNLVEIVNYSLVGQAAATGTLRYVTYQADLLNLGQTDLGPLTASLTSVDPSMQVVGQGALDFLPVSANGRVASGNTFTILIDPSVPVDFSKLKWTFRSSRSVLPGR